MISTSRFYLNKLKKTMILITVSKKTILLRNIKIEKEKNKELIHQNVFMIAKFVHQIINKLYEIR